MLARSLCGVKLVSKKLERIMHMVFLLSATVSIIAVALICIFLFAKGIPAIFEIGFTKFIFGTEWKPNNSPASYGILPMIVGSIYVTLGAVILGVPLGIFCALFLGYSCPKRLYKVLRPAIEILASIPSVVYGFFALVFIVPLISKYFYSNGFSILTAAIILAVMILPTIISVSLSAIKAVPRHYYEASLALGASHERSIFFVVLPAAKSGIFAAVVLGIGRAIGETMAVVLIAGNQARMPDGILKGVRTMTSNIVLEMGYATDLHQDALIATGVVLFLFILAINLVFQKVKRGLKNA